MEDTKITGDFLNSVRIGEPTTFKNLTVLPLFSAQGPENGFSLLDDAIRTDKFRVTEVSEGGSVPELRVINELDTDVLIIDEEELVGAKQNRIVNTTILVGGSVKWLFQSPVSSKADGITGASTSHQAHRTSVQACGG